MRTFFPIIFSAVVILIFGLLAVLMLRLFNRTWWARPRIRRLAWSLPLTGFAMVSVWGLGEYLAKDWISLPAALIAMLVFIFEMGLMLSLPVSGLLHFLNTVLDWIGKRHRRRPAPAIDHGRRVFLKGVAAATPLITLATGTGGLVRAFEPVRIPRKEFFFENLPPELEGFKIWHVSDIHLRHYVTLDHLADAVERAMPLAPDLVLVTGDIADDLAQLPGALSMLHEIKAPLGCYASLGNHEYFRGVGEVRDIFDRSPVPLFVNQGVHLLAKGTPLFVGGIDDPRRMGQKEERFYEITIDRTLSGSHNDEFIVLMSHRPDAFDIAAARGIPLTLAGHTHGGQIGLFGRSAFESYWQDRYLWGHYINGPSQLYTSSGMGHWFPFRLGCPAEAPFVVLRKGTPIASGGV
ncbi:MAG: metallophosphoesterase [Candidatus Zixiibacteriota bacterium]